MKELYIREIGGLQKKTGSKRYLASIFERLDNEEDTVDRQLQVSLQTLFPEQTKGRRQIIYSNCRRYSFHNIDHCLELLRPDLVAEKAEKAAAKAAAKAAVRAAAQARKRQR